jgi:hypothetical protein
MERRAKSKGGFPMFKKTCWLVLIVTLLGMTLFGTWGGAQEVKISYSDWQLAQDHAGTLVQREIMLDMG